MSFTSQVLTILIGIPVIIISAEVVIKSSLNLAKRFGFSDEFIGMTLLSIGTSLPEIVTHLVASFRIIIEPSSMDELSALSIGTNVGSDIFQQNFLLGFIAIVGTVAVSKKDLIKDVGGLVITTLIVFLFSMGGTITRLEGGILTFGYIAYIYVLKRYGATKSGKLQETSENVSYSVLRNIFVTVSAFAIMAVAADKVLDASIVIVKRTFLSYSFFGVIVLGVATALPELATSLISVIKKRAAISTGILIGSNITNPAFALGLGALISTYKVPGAVICYDLPFKVITAVLIYLMMMKGILKKGNAVILIIFYMAYLYFRGIYFPTDF